MGLRMERFSPISFKTNVFNKKIDTKRRTKKKRHKVSFFEYGGGLGIRTPGRLLTYNGFQDRRLQPLSQSTSFDVAYYRELSFLCLHSNREFLQIY